MGRQMMLGGLVLALGVTVPSPCAESSEILIVRVEGAVSVDGDRAAAPGERIKLNSIVRTGRGRARVTLAPSVELLLGEDSSFRLIQDGQEDIRIELTGGSAFVRTGALPNDVRVHVACEDVVGLSSGGIYRFDRNQEDGFCRLKVYRGVADVRLATVNMAVATGETINLSSACGDMIPRIPFNVNDADRLDDATGQFRSGWIP